MEKVQSVRVLGRSVTDDEAKLLLVRRDIIILKYDPLLYNCSIFIMLIKIFVGAENTILVLRAIIHNMVGQLTNPTRKPFACMKCIDQFE